MQSVSSRSKLSGLMSLWITCWECTTWEREKDMSKWRKISLSLSLSAFLTVFKAQDKINEVLPTSVFREWLLHRYLLYHRSVRRERERERESLKYQHPPLGRYSQYRMWLRCLACHNLPSGYVLKHCSNQNTQNMWESRKRESVCRRMYAHVWICVCVCVKRYSWNRTLMNEYF